MPRDLFGDVVHPPRSAGGRRWYSLPVSILVHAAIVVVAIVVPLTVADLLPATPAMVTFVVEAAPPPPPPAAPVARTPAAHPILAVNPGAAPVEAPRGIAPDQGLEPETTAGRGVEGGLPNGVEGAGIVMMTEAPPPPPRPGPQPPVRVFSGIRPPTKIRDAAPLYPQVAQAARVQGTVILEAVIGVDGRVVEARVLRSIPLLDQAALDAVRQWRYTPTLLNGVPVAVVMTVTVTFTLR